MIKFQQCGLSFQTLEIPQVLIILVYIMQAMFSDFRNTLSAKTFSKV